MSGTSTEAMLVARDLYQRNPQLLDRRMPSHPAGSASSSGVCLLPADGEVNLLTAIRATSAHMRGLPDYPIDITYVPEDVAKVVRDEEGELKAPDRIMRSLLERSSDKASILVLQSLNPCWTRFSICKEASHTIMNEKQGARAVSVQQQLAMAYSMRRGEWLVRDLTGEEFAFIIAVELLLPVADRAEFLKRRRLGEDTKSLARSYWVPKDIVDMFFETPFGQISSDLWS